MNSTEGAPGQTSDGYGWGTCLGKRSAVDEDTERKSPVLQRYADARERRLDATRQALAPRIMAHQVQHSLLVNRIHVHELHLLQVGGNPGEYPRPDQPELLRTGDKDAEAGRRSRLGSGERRDDPGSVIPSTQRAAAQPAFARQEARQERRSAAQTEPYGSNRAVEAERSHDADRGNGHSGDPHRHETPRHGVRLSLRVEVGHDPAPRADIATGRDQVGVLPDCFAEGHPSEPDAGRKNGCGRKAAGPHDKSRPGRDVAGTEEREENQGEEAKAVSENGKRSETRGTEGEPLENDGVSERPQVGGDELSSGGGFGGSGFTRERQDLAGSLVQRQEAALGRRLVPTRGGATVASAARLVSSVICSASSSSSRCCSKVWVPSSFRLSAISSLT